MIAHTATTATPFQLTKRERVQLWKDLKAKGFDRDYISFLAVTLNMPALWQFNPSQPPQLDHSPAVALYLRDCWAVDVDHQGGEPIQFADEMRALAVHLWTLIESAGAGAGSNNERVENALNMLMYMLEQQGERLKICWLLSQPEYRSLAVNREILQAILSTAHRVHATGIGALQFNAWLTQEWLPTHLRYYLYEQAERQFGKLKE